MTEEEALERLKKSPLKFFQDKLQEKKEIDYEKELDKIDDRNLKDLC